MPSITMAKLLSERLKTNSVPKTGRIFGGIVAQSAPITAHVHLPISCGMLSKCIQWSVVRMTNNKLRSRVVSVVHLEVGQKAISKSGHLPVESSLNSAWHVQEGSLVERH